MTPVWLDADPGFDDWMTMLILAQAHREKKIKWLGTSIVHGNAPLATTWANAQAIASQYMLPCELFQGCATALEGSQITAQNILGENGMRTTAEPLPTTSPESAASKNAIEALIQAVEQNPHNLVLIATGPLTNIAQALKQQPRIAKQVKQLILMGGSTDRGNHTPAAEFNIFADPEAASIVFNSGLNSGLNIAMFGLNVCRQVLLTQEDVKRFKQLPSPEAKCFAGYLDGYQKIRSHDGSAPMPLYDPIVAAYLLSPTLFDLDGARVDIELRGEFTRGMTVCNFKNKSNPNASVAMKCNAEEVRELMFSYTQTYLNGL
jgi:purine nucleosidase